MNTQNRNNHMRYMPLLCLVCPYLYFLNEESASLYIPSVLASICILVVSGALISAMIHRAPQVLQIVVISLLLVPLSDQLISVSFVRETLLVWLFGVLLPLLVLKRFIVFPLAVFLLVSSLVSIVSIALNSSEMISTSSRIAGSVQANDDLPAVVHVVFDEMTSVEHLASNLVNREQLELITSLILDKSELVLGHNVFSRSTNTVHSLSSLVNIDAELEPYIRQFEANTLRHKINTVSELKYFDLMSNLGYQLSVVESEFLDFCAQGHPKTCTKYQSSGVNALGRAQMKLPVELMVLLRKYLKSMKSSTYVLNWFSRQQLSDPMQDNSLVSFSNWDIYESPLIAYQANQYLLDTLKTLKPGEMVFAHLLIPHFTYFLDSQCVPKENAFFRNYVLSNSKNENTPESRTLRYAEYSEQYQCALMMIDEILRTVPNRDQTLFIFHGDHGSRIARSDAIDSSSTGVTLEDMNDFYNTFFAVKYPIGVDGTTIRDLPLEQALLNVLKSVYSGQSFDDLQTDDRMIYSQTGKLFPFPEEKGEAQESKEPLNKS